MKNVLLNNLLKLSSESLSGEPIVYKLTAAKCDKPTRKGKYITIAAGLSNQTYFVGVNDKGEEITEQVN